MNCKEFKEEFKGRMLLAFIVENDRTHILKLKTEYITYFMRHFIDEHYILWRIVFFYEISMQEMPEFLGEINNLEMLIKEKAQYLYVMAKKEEQPERQCYFKKTTYAPNMKHMVGKKYRLKELRMIM